MTVRSLRAIRWGIGVLLSAVVLGFSSTDRKLAEFEEPFKFPRLAIGENEIYIADARECVIHIYSKEDFRHLSQFGKVGQGPEDFEFIDLIRVFPDHLFIPSDRKVSYFSKRGELLRTISPPHPSTGGYVPVGPNFAGQRYVHGDPKVDWFEIVLELFDPKFKKIKELYTARLKAIESYDFKSGKRNILAFSACFKLDVHEGKLFMGNSTEGFFFRVFDARGKSLYDINLPYDKRRVSAGDRRAHLEETRKRIGEQRFKEVNARFNTTFPDFYPAFSDFTINDGKIYVFLYRVPGSPQEVLILNLRGGVIGRFDIAVEPELTSESPYCIYDGGLYYMKYNEDTYKWELHLEDLRSSASPAIGSGRAASSSGS